LAGRDRDSWRQLVARARFATAPPETWRKAVGDLIGRRRFLDSRACRAYARRLAALTQILRSASTRAPAAALELADYALHRLIAVYSESDDSSGVLGDVLREVGEIHRRVAKAARPEPSAFARSYFKLRLADGWGVVGDVTTVSEVLGRKGCATLEALAQAQLDALPSLAKSGARWDGHDSVRFSLQQLLEELARFGGDVDAVISRKVQAISSPWSYLDLAGFCREHGRERQGHDWLERGLKAYPNDLRLLDMLAQSHEREGFPEDALSLRWRAFQRQPGEDTYLKLQEIAGVLSAWGEWRTKALEHIQQQATRNQWSGDDLRVTLMLTEGNLIEAWRIARVGTLNGSTWARLAPALEADEPEGALRAYRTLVRIGIDQAHRQGYRHALDWLQRMARLHVQLGTEADFAAYLDTLRQTCRAKPNFVAMLDEFAKSRGLQTAT
jgi:hypothetical protein